MVTIGVLDPEQHDRLQRLRELVADGVVNAQAVDFLLARDALPRLVRELPQAIDAKSLEAWQVAGLFLVRGGRAYDGIAVFEALYEMLLERQVTNGARIHKGMPLVWIRDAHVNLDHTALAQRFIMLTLIEDAIYSNGEIDPYTTGSYFRLVWYHGMSDKQFRQYARDSADFARSNELATRYPERVLQELDQLWMTAFPSTAEALLYPANRRYVAELLKMAGGFAKALVNANWTAGPSMSQTQIYTSVVAGQPRPVVYFLVDAMRFEMGVELAERLPKAAEVGVRHAVGVLPSITSIGMAALQPGASASFTVVEQGGKLGARIEDAFLPDLAARKKFAAARVTNLTDMTLDELLSLAPSKLTKKIEDAGETSAHRIEGEADPLLVVTDGGEAQPSEPDRGPWVSLRPARAIVTPDAAPEGNDSGGQHRRPACRRRRRPIASSAGAEGAGADPRRNGDDYPMTSLSDGLGPQKDRTAAGPASRAAPPGLTGPPPGAARLDTAVPTRT